MVMDPRFYTGQLQDLTKVISQLFAYLENGVNIYLLSLLGERN